MRLSCYGCRVLRKGCSDECIIKPCLQWIKTSESQANATLFLAKFYGRAGLMKLINSGPQHLRPAIFKSLLYEACGRIVNPVYGSVGLLSTGSWQQCQAAVEAVLRGEPITQISTSDQFALDVCDIRHLSKKEDWNASDQLHKVKSKSLFKRPASKQKPNMGEQTGSDLMIGFGGSRSVSPDCVLSKWSPSLGADSMSAETSLDEAADGSDLDLELTLG